MESVSVKFSDEEFDEVVHNSLQDCGDLVAVVKDHATANGRPCVALTFTVALPDGTLQRVQTVTTAACFLAIAAAVRGRLGFLGMVE